MLTLKIEQMTVNGAPNLCPECGSEAYTLDGAGFIDALPVRGNCWQSHSWEEALITLGDLKRIDAARTGRVKAEDEDTFEIVIGGAVLAGTLHPDVTVDDLKRVTRDVYWKKIIKPAARRQKNKAKRAIKKAGRNALATITEPAKKTVAAAKAAAIGAAWDWQAGGHEPDPDYTPEPVNPCPACKGKGGFTIKSRIHDATRVNCSVCYGTGEID